MYLTSIMNYDWDRCRRSRISDEPHEKSHKIKKEKYPSDRTLIQLLWT